MDPLAALIYIVRNHSDADVELAEHIGAYQEWRSRNGFEPLWVGTEHEKEIDRYVTEQRLTTYENADAIVEHAARELQTALRARTGRDFGLRYSSRVLDAISDAFDGPCLHWRDASYTRCGDCIECLKTSASDSGYQP